MRYLVTLSLVIVSIAFFSCSKGTKNYTFQDLMSADSIEVKSAIQEELGNEGLQLLKDYKLKLKATNSEPDYNKTLAQIFTEQKEYNKVIEPRKDIYSMAVVELISILKSPSTARISYLTKYDSDSLRIWYNSDSSIATIDLLYEAQNGFGAYRSDVYSKRYKKIDNNNWTDDFEISYHHDPTWGFNLLSEKSIVLQDLDSKKIEYNDCSDGDYKGISFENYGYYFLAKAEKIEVYFNKEDRINKLNIYVKKGDMAVETYNLLMNTGAPYEALPFASYYDGFVFENATIRVITTDPLLSEFEIMPRHYHL